jgi:hypothetical protein
MTGESAGDATGSSAGEKSRLLRRLRPESIVSLLGALGVSAGILVLAYEEYWIFFQQPYFFAEPIPPAYLAFLNVGYLLETAGYGLLVAGVLLVGVGWRMGRLRRRVGTIPPSVFDRYRRNWGVGIGTFGFVLVAIGLLVAAVEDAGQLKDVTIISLPAAYIVSDFLAGIGIAIWAIGSFLDHISFA